jgi:hypothetical protein
VQHAALSDHHNEAGKQTPLQRDSKHSELQPSTLPKTHPEAILQRQRLLGNQNTRSYLQRKGKAKASTVQRTMYLGDADLNIYQNSDKQDEEYAFVHKGEFPFYIKYDAVKKVQDNANLKIFREARSPYNFKKDLDYSFTTNDALAQELRGIMGNAHYQDDTDGGKVKAAALHNVTWSQIVQNILERGAMYLPVGGGSRLPNPAGLLLVCNQTKENALKRLGIEDASSYSNVILKDMSVHPRQFEEMLTKAKDDPASKPFVFIGNSMNESVIYMSGTEQTRPKNARVTLNGNNYADDLSDLPVHLKGGIDASFASLKKPTADTGWVEGTKLVTIGREDGQAAQMDQWNALGAAAYANKYLGKNYDLHQSWEWLHIQGAQIGGATVGGNLVPGLFATNSFMIPFETMIKNWATEDPTKFAARFRAESDGANVFATKIILSILARGHKQLGTLGPVDLLTFDPLQGRVIDKLSNEIMKRNIDKSVHVVTF